MKKNYFLNHLHVQIHTYIQTYILQFTGCSRLYCNKTVVKNFFIYNFFFYIKNWLYINKKKKRINGRKKNK